MSEEVIIPSGFTQNPIDGTNPPPMKKKRNLPGTPDPEAEVIALSPKTLMATNRFLCEICGKGFQRDQNLQLHRRGHNLPWKLKQRTSKEVRKRVYVCPEKTCVHHHPSRALGDLTGIKKHFCRKHGEKKWKCEKCSKRYAVQSDWKAHSKTCGTREYKCDCGTIFSRRDSFITHRAFCDALAEETARVTAASNITVNNMNYHFMGASLGPPPTPTPTHTPISMAQHFPTIFKQNIPPPPPPNNSNHHHPHHTSNPIRQAGGLSLWMGHGQEIPPLASINPVQNFTSDSFLNPCPNNPPPPPPPTSYPVNWDFGNTNNKLTSNTAEELSNDVSSDHHLPNLSTNNVKEGTIPSLFSTQLLHHHQTPSPNMSATALLQKAAQIGSNTSDPSFLAAGTFGLKCNDNNMKVQQGNKFCGLYAAMTSVSTTMESSVDDHLTSLNHQLQMYPSKRRHIIQNDQDHSISTNNGPSGGGGGGQTRDFLGVGIQPICHPSSINGWI